MNVMNVYFAGIGGVALGPLAEIARDLGYAVSGSDPNEGLMTKRLAETGITVNTDQSGGFLLMQHQRASIDWFIYTSAMPEDHPELVQARQLRIAHIVKRNEFINFILAEKQLKMIAVAGTHGKTTTTAMFVWALQQLGIPVSYSVGTTISFGPSGKYTLGSKYFIYECDEFDRNFLAFTPDLSLITSIDYDHPDTYPTRADYAAAFTQFMNQSSQVIMWDHDKIEGLVVPPTAWQLHDSEAINVALAGIHNRANATLIAKAAEFLELTDQDSIRTALDSFPGSARRFEKLGDNLYTDYGHHPAEIAATLQLARELSDHVVLVYQPHQNARQHQIRDEYTRCMQLAEKIYWLPTYLTREDPALPVLSPEELTENLVNRSDVSFADLNESLWESIVAARAEGKLVLCMGAGTIDSWLRKQLSN
jgi:UDP-N-acetylmuramate--alanine ligase